MWTCTKCGERLEDQFDRCWKCQTPKAGLNAAADSSNGGSGGKTLRLAYKYFRGTLATWDDLFEQAAEFATETGRERVLGISHSADRGDGVVTVWYWTRADESDNH